MIRTYRIEGVNTPDRKRYALSHFSGVNTNVAEENLPIRFSPKSYNFSLGKGVLSEGVGVEKGYIRKNGTSWQLSKRTVTTKFVKFFRYTMHSLDQRSEKLVAVGENGDLYDMSLLNQYPLFGRIGGGYGNILSAAPYVYQDQDGLLISAESGLYFLRDYSMTRLSFSKIFTSMCVHNDRVFATLFSDEYKLYFSDDFDPSNWNVSLHEGGSISFDTSLGRIVELKSFGGQLYLFFEHGIMRMTAYNDQTEFQLAKVYLSVGTIYKKTVTDCGDRIAFQSSDGVFLFDGVSVKKIMTEIEDLFEDGREVSHAVYHGGKYYLACKLGMDSTIASGTNSLLVYDLWKNTVEIGHDLGVQAMIPLDCETICGVLAEATSPSSFLGLVTLCGKIDATPTHKLWLSPVITLGPVAGKKFLREIRVRSSAAATLGVKADGIDYTYALSAGLNKVKVMRPFDRLQVSLSSDAAEIRITEADLTIDHFGE